MRVLPVRHARSTPHKLAAVTLQLLPTPIPPSTDSGFGEYDHQYFYSRVAENGMLMNVGKVGAAYLLDGVVDINTIAKGTGLEGLLGRAGLDWITKVRSRVPP